MKQQIAFGPTACFLVMLVGCGSGSSGDSATGGASTGGSSSGGATGGSAGTGSGGQQTVCGTRVEPMSPGSSGAPRTFPFQFGVASNSGNSLFKLEEKTADGWRVSRISGNWPDIQLMTDDGLLSDLVVGDTIRILVHSECAAFSGCATYGVVLKDDVLITAAFNDRPQGLPGFAQTLGVDLTLKPACALSPVSNCFESEIQTQYSLSVGTDPPVVIEQHSSQAVTINGRPYTLWLGEAVDNAAEGAAIPFRCRDAAAFWWPGSISLTIAP